MRNKKLQGKELKSTIISRMILVALHQNAIIRIIHTYEVYSMLKVIINKYLSNSGIVTKKKEIVLSFFDQGSKLD